MTTAIFLAAPLARSRHVRTVASALAVQFQVTSAWHDDDPGRDPRDDDDRISRLSTNLSAIERADVVVGLLYEGVPRCTLFELGYAAALGKPFVVIHDSGTGRFLGDSHGNCVRLDLRTQSLEDLPLAIETAAGLVAVPRDSRVTLPAPPSANDEAAESREGTRLTGYERGVTGG